MAAKGRPSAEHRQKALADAGARIALTPGHERERVYTHAAFCNIGFPRSDVRKDNWWHENLGYWMRVEAGERQRGSNQALPYGVMPRLIMNYVDTYAVLNRSPIVPIGRKPSEFLQLLGYKDKQGSRYTSLKRQMLALIAAEIHLGIKGEILKGVFIRGQDDWNNEWPCELALKTEYLESLLTHAVPSCRDAVSELGASSLAIDIYRWLTIRLWRINKSTTVRWKQLRTQFGGTRNPESFKAWFTRELNTVLMVYPEAKVEVMKGGIKLSKSSPPIPPRVG